MKKIKLLTIIILFSCKSLIFAYHPLITDDTNTQGQGKFQIELNGEYDYDKSFGIQKSIQANAALSIGIIETVDIIATLPYLYYKNDAGTEKGISDASFEVKWKFTTTGPLSFAIKPGITIPTGNENRGLGNGKAGFSSYLISTADFRPFAVHINLGYLMNRNTLDYQVNLWHASIAADYEIIKNLKIAANIGIDRNTDKAKTGLSQQPAFMILGFLYSIKENFDLDAGIKFGLNTDATDIAFLAGITYRF